jgi:hypothetical protein
MQLKKTDPNVQQKTPPGKGVKRRVESSPNVNQLAFGRQPSKSSGQESFETPDVLIKKKTLQESKNLNNTSTPIKLNESAKLARIDEEQSVGSKGLSSKIGRGLSSKFSLQKKGVMNQLLPTINEKKDAQDGEVSQSVEEIDIAEH